MNDKDPSKICLAIGAYRDNEGNPHVYDIVRKVEEEMLHDGSNKEYLPIDGDPVFNQGTKKLIFGEDCKILDNIVTVQSLSGTGGLRLASELLFQTLPKETKIYISDPTWPNHLEILKVAGFHNQMFYPYYDAATNSLNFKGLMDTLNTAPPKSIVLLHGCAHNPTGIDPTKEQWDEIVKLCKTKELIPFVDLAYQGFATGDLDNDAYLPQKLASEGMEFLISQSFAKNMGLYGERVGALHVICKSKEETPKVLSNLKTIIRSMYSNPPCHGVFIMKKIFSNPVYMEEWKKEVARVSGRIQEMRKLLYDELVAINTPGNWDHIIKQIGMFSYTGLTPEQCKSIVEKHHVYLTANGRASMPGINHGNVKRLAAAIKAVVTEFPKH